MIKHIETLLTAVATNLRVPDLRDAAFGRFALLDSTQLLLHSCQLMRAANLTKQWIDERLPLAHVALAPAIAPTQLLARHRSGASAATPVAGALAPVTLDVCQQVVKLCRVLASYRIPFMPVYHNDDAHDGGDLHVLEAFVDAYTQRLLQTLGNKASVVAVFGMGDVHDAGDREEKEGDLGDDASGGAAAASAGHADTSASGVDVAATQITVYLKRVVHNKLLLVVEAHVSAQLASCTFYASDLNGLNLMALQPAGLAFRNPFYVRPVLRRVQRQGRSTLSKGLVQDQRHGNGYLVSTQLPSSALAFHQTLQTNAMVFDFHVRLLLQCLAQLCTATTAAAAAAAPAVVAAASGPRRRRTRPVTLLPTVSLLSQPPGAGGGAGAGVGDNGVEPLAPRVPAAVMHPLRCFLRRYPSAPRGARFRVLHTTVTLPAVVQGLDRDLHVSALNVCLFAAARELPDCQPTLGSLTALGDDSVLVAASHDGLFNSAPPPGAALTHVLLCSPVQPTDALAAGTGAGAGAGAGTGAGAGAGAGAGNTSDVQFDVHVVVSDAVLHVEPRPVSPVRPRAGGTATQAAAGAGAGAKHVEASSFRQHKELRRLHYEAKKKAKRRAPRHRGTAAAVDGAAAASDEPAQATFDPDSVLRRAATFVLDHLTVARNMCLRDRLWQRLRSVPVDGGPSGGVAPPSSRRQRPTSPPTVAALGSAVSPSSSAAAVRAWRPRASGATRQRGGTAGSLSFDGDLHGDGANYNDDSDDTAAAESERVALLLMAVGEEDAPAGSAVVASKDYPGRSATLNRSHSSMRSKQMSAGPSKRRGRGHSGDPHAFPGMTTAEGTPVSVGSSDVAPRASMGSSMSPLSAGADGDGDGDAVVITGLAWLPRPRQVCALSVPALLELLRLSIRVPLEHLDPQLADLASLPVNWSPLVGHLMTMYGSRLRFLHNGPFANLFIVPESSNLLLQVVVKDWSQSATEAPAGEDATVTVAQFWCLQRQRRPAMHLRERRFISNLVAHVSYWLWRQLTLPPLQ